MGPRFTVSYSSSSAELNLDFRSVLKLLFSTEELHELLKLHYVLWFKENLQCKNPLFSLTDFVNQSTQPFLRKSEKKKTVLELFRPYEAFGMALLELIAQKWNSKRRNFWKVKTTNLQCVTWAKFIYKFRHVTNVRNKLSDKNLSEMNSVSSYHKATSHSIRKILKLLSLLTS